MWATHCEGGAREVLLVAANEKDIHGIVVQQVTLCILGVYVYACA